MFSTRSEQFLLTAAALFLINYLSSCIGCVVSLIGSAIVLLSLSWCLTKCIRRQYLSNKVISSFKKAVLVTGCDTGFGNRLAVKLNTNGYMVYATVLDEASDGAKHLSNNCDFPNNIKVIRMDVTSDMEVTKAYEFICDDINQKGLQLWGLVNNAGIALWSPIDWSTIDSYKKIIEINVFGMVRITRTFLPLLRESKGRIVNMGSIMGLVSMPLRAHYCMSKTAVLSFSDALRRETHKWGVRVSVIIPGPFKTHLTSEENMIKMIDNDWQNTSESVKQLYGDEYLNSTKQNLLRIYATTGSDNLDLVVDKIIDAIKSEEPQIIYKVIGEWRTRLLIVLVQWLPIELIDLLLLYLSNK